jgi:hypothetical protein
MNIEDIEKQYFNSLPMNPSIKFRDGVLSIQASPFHYCHPKHDHGPYNRVEVAYMIDDKFQRIPELIDVGADDVYGYVDIREVIALLIDEGYTEKEIVAALPR